MNGLTSAATIPPSQRDNPTIARRFNAGYSSSTARVPQGRQNERHVVSAMSLNFIRQTSVIPPGLGFLWGFIPALKCRAIVMPSLRDFAPSAGLFAEPQIFNHILPHCGIHPLLAIVFP